MSASKVTFLCVVVSGGKGYPPRRYIAEEGLVHLCTHTGEGPRRWGMQQVANNGLCTCDVSTSCIIQCTRMINHNCNTPVEAAGRFLLYLCTSTGIYNVYCIQVLIAYQ